MLNMLAGGHQYCWLPSADPSATGSLLYASPSATSDQSHSSAFTSSSISAQPSPVIPPKVESKLMGQYASFCAPTPSANPQQHLANFVQSAFGNGFAGSGGVMVPNGVERMRPAKRRARPVPDERKDETYRERRRKNNESAQRSRQIRRKKEEETQMRNAELEAEIARLKQENYGLMLELFHLRQQFGMALGGGHQIGEGGTMTNSGQPKIGNPL